jgi:hypothetical protein
MQRFFVACALDDIFLIGGFVVAGLAAGWTVVEAVFTKAHVNLTLAQAAVLLALAASLTHVALVAEVLGFGSHSENVAWVEWGQKFRW